MRDLEVKMMELQSLVVGTRNQGHIELLKTKRKALDDLLGVKAQGALVRSLFQSVKEMDGPTRFFFSLEKNNGQS